MGIPLLAGIIAWRTLGKDLRFFWSIFLLGVIAECIVYYTRSNGIHNVWLFNVFFPVEFCVFMYTLSLWVAESWRKWFRGSILIFLVFYFLLQWWVYDPGQLNTAGKYIQSTLLLVGALGVLVHLLPQFRHPMSVDPRFWVLAGMLIYFGGTAFVFLAGQLYIDGKLPGVWIIHSVCNISANLMFGAGFIYARVTP